MTIRFVWIRRRVAQLRFSLVALIPEIGSVLRGTGPLPILADALFTRTRHVTRCPSSQCFTCFARFFRALSPVKRKGLLQSDEGNQVWGLWSASILFPQSRAARTKMAGRLAILLRVVPSKLFTTVVLFVSNTKTVSCTDDGLVLFGDSTPLPQSSTGHARQEVCLSVPLMSRDV